MKVLISGSLKHCIGGSFGLGTQNKQQAKQPHFRNLSYFNRQISLTTPEESKVSEPEAAYAQLKPLLSNPFHLMEVSKKRTGFPSFSSNY